MTGRFNVFSREEDRLWMTTCWNKL